MGDIPERLQHLVIGQLSDITREACEMQTKNLDVVVAIYNDWLDLLYALLDCYQHPELTKSLLFQDFLTLGQELHWLLRNLAWGRYSAILRSLRHTWEMMVQGCQADLLFKQGTFEEKVAWLDKKRLKFGWGNKSNPGPVQSIIFELVRPTDQKTYQEHWYRMNRAVHPSKATRIKRLDDVAAMMTERLEPKQAKQIVQCLVDVFDLVWLIVLKRFTRISFSITLRDNTFENATRFRQALTKES